MYNDNHLKEKTIEDVIKVFGKPQKIEYETIWVNDKDYNFVEDGYELVLIYYTDNKLLNHLVLLPLWGTRVFIDQNGKVIAFKEFLY